MVGGAGMSPDWPLLVCGPPGAWCAAPQSTFSSYWRTSHPDVGHLPSPSLLSISAPSVWILDICDNYIIDNISLFNLG